MLSYVTDTGMVKCPSELPKLSEKSSDTLSQFEEFSYMPLEMETGYTCRKYIWWASAAEVLVWQNQEAGLYGTENHNRKAKDNDNALFWKWMLLNKHTKMPEVQNGSHFPLCTLFLYTMLSSSLSLLSIKFWKYILLTRRITYFIFT